MRSITRVITKKAKLSVTFSLQRHFKIWGDFKLLYEFSPRVLRDRKTLTPSHLQKEKVLHVGLEVNLPFPNCLCSWTSPGSSVFLTVAAWGSRLVSQHVSKSVQKIKAAGTEVGFSWGRRKRMAFYRTHHRLFLWLHRPEKWGKNRLLAHNNSYNNIFLGELSLCQLPRHGIPKYSKLLWGRDYHYHHITDKENETQVR